ncbi:hypothetical protein Tco_1296121 [Tanacetum coccineum]
MITYGLCQKTTGYDKIQKNDLWLLSMFDARHQNGVLTKDVVRSLSALIYCRDLDTTILRDLIDSDGKLIPEDPQPGVPRVGIPRPPRASMQDLYDRMGRMEICQEAIEQIEYREPTTHLVMTIGLDLPKQILEAQTEARKPKNLSAKDVGEQYSSLSDLEKEHTKSVYLRNEKDKKRGVEYVMSKILGFYKECLELGPEYVTGMDDDGEVTLYLMRRSLEVLRKFHWMILGGQFNQLSHVSSPLLSKPGEY